MDAGTYLLKDHELRVVNILNDIVKHGYGEISIHVSETSKLKTKVLIIAGRSWAYFISKEIKDLDTSQIL